MKHGLSFLLAALTLVGATALTTWSLAQEPAAQDEAAMMMEMMKLAAPGKEHEKLMLQAGEWTVAARMRMGPDAPWQDMPMSVKSQKALGGRWLISQVKGNMAGMPFEGLQIEGYNNLTKQYDAYWTDNFSTWFVTTTGNFDAQGAREMKGSMIDFHSPDGRPYRSVTTYQDSDHFRTVMFDTIPPVGDVEMMIMDFSRVK